MDENTTLVNFRWENRKKFICCITIIDISGTTYYLEDLNKGRLTLT